MDDTNKALIRRWYHQMWDAGQLELANELVAPSFVSHQLHNPAHLPRGPEGARQVVKLYRHALPDMHHTIEEQLLDGNKVVTRWTMRGTHKGDLFGIPATGKRAMVSGISIEQIVNGQITESWFDLDLLGLMQQIGAVPAFPVRMN